VIFWGSRRICDCFTFGGLIVTKMPMHLRTQTLVCVCTQTHAWT